MPRKKTKLPKFTGSLTEKIDTKINWWLFEGERREELLDKHARAVVQAQHEKLTELGKQLGISPPTTEYSPRMNLPDVLAAGQNPLIALAQAILWVHFYERVSTDLAAGIGIPGFETKKISNKKIGEWPKQIIAMLVAACNVQKQKGKAPSKTCLEFVHAMDPSLKNTAEGKRAARTLLKEVSIFRGEAKDAAERNAARQKAKERPVTRH